MNIKFYQCPNFLPTFKTSLSTLRIPRLFLLLTCQHLPVLLTTLPETASVVKLGTPLLWTSLGPLTPVDVDAASPAWLRPLWAVTSLPHCCSPSKT